MPAYSEGSLVKLITSNQSTLGQWQRPAGAHSHLIVVRSTALSGWMGGWEWLGPVHYWTIKDISIESITWCSQHVKELI